MLLQALFLVLSVCAHAVPQLQPPPREEQPHTAVDLTTESFDAHLRSLPGTRVLCEFYAKWCPHCRHYAHDYEQIARFFAAQPPENGKPAVLVARVDCAVERTLCAEFNIHSFPTITFGSAEQFLSRANVTMHPGNEDRDPESIVSWVAQLSKRPFKYVPLPDQASSVTGEEWLATAEHHRLQGGGHSGKKPWTLADVELSTVELFEQITSTPLLHTGAEKRAALFQLARWWSAAHPSSKCQKGAQKLVALFDTVWWPETAEVAPQQLLTYQICGPRDQISNEWKACKGSLPNSRGFTCGLWLLFHTSAARLPDTGGSYLVEGLRAFGLHFFMCGVCQQHFSKMIASPGSLDNVKTREEAMLWVWHAHNQVNARLAETERAAGSISAGDPMFPKIQFPDARMCPACRRPHPSSDGSSTVSNGDPDSIDWNEAEVLAFLDQAYSDDGSDEQAQDSSSTGVDSTQQGSSIPVSGMVGSTTSQAAQQQQQQTTASATGAGVNEGGVQSAGGMGGGGDGSGGGGSKGAHAAAVLVDEDAEVRTASPPKDADDSRASGAHGTQHTHDTPQENGPLLGANGTLERMSSPALGLVLPQPYSQPYSQHQQQQQQQQHLEDAHVHTHEVGANDSVIPPRGSVSVSGSAVLDASLSDLAAARDAHSTHSMTHSTRSSAASLRGTSAAAAAAAHTGGNNNSSSGSGGPPLAADSREPESAAAGAEGVGAWEVHPRFSFGGGPVVTRVACSEAASDKHRLQQPQWRGGLDESWEFKPPLAPPPPPPSPSLTAALTAAPRAPPASNLAPLPRAPTPSLSATQQQQQQLQQLQQQPQPARPFPRPAAAYSLSLPSSPSPSHSSSSYTTNPLSAHTPNTVTSAPPARASALSAQDLERRRRKREVRQALGSHPISVSALDFTLS